MKNLTIIVLGIVLPFVFACDNNPTQEAQQFADTMGFSGATVSCMEIDSDDDGYVSCTISEKRPDGAVRLTAIECASQVTGCLNTGCRMQKPGFVSKSL